MRRTLWIIGVPAAAIAAFVVAWRRNRRLGSRFVNVVVNPALMGRGLAGGRASELGMIEHIGRRSGTRRLTPIHPEVTADGFRVMVPLGPESAWARNVLAAGHCRLQLHDTVYELDEPKIVAPREIDELPAIVRGVAQALGFEYLVLRKFGSSVGHLDAEPAGAHPAPEVPGEPLAAKATRHQIGRERPSPEPADSEPAQAGPAQAEPVSSAR